MNGLEHFRMAEDLVERAATGKMSDASRVWLVDCAKVHATLADAALNYGGMYWPDKETR